MQAYTESMVENTAAKLYEGEGLQLPPIPPEFSGKLQQLTETSFASRAAEWSLYDMGRFVHEVIVGKPAPYLAFGFAGHGFASVGVHYYRVTPAAAIFIQIRWASVLTNDADVPQRHNVEIKLAESLLEAAGKPGAVPEDRRLVVVQSDFQQSRFGWSARQGGTQDVTWTYSLIPMVDALAAVG